jgi:hypothetical protein
MKRISWETIKKRITGVKSRGDKSICEEDCRILIKTGPDTTKLTDMKE